MSLRLLLAVPALALTIPATVNANPMNSNEFAATVAHDDLNLASPEDASRLDERVRTKIRQMCNNGGRDGVSVRLERECRTGALAATAPQVRLAVTRAEAEAVRFAQTETASPAATPGV